MTLCNANYWYKDFGLLGNRASKSIHVNQITSKSILVTYFSTLSIDNIDGWRLRNAGDIGTPWQYKVCVYFREGYKL